MMDAPITNHRRPNLSERAVKRKATEEQSVHTSENWLALGLGPISSLMKTITDVAGIKAQKVAVTLIEIDISPPIRATPEK